MHIIDHLILFHTVTPAIISQEVLCLAINNEWMDGEKGRGPQMRFAAYSKDEMMYETVFALRLN